MGKRVRPSDQLAASVDQLRRFERLYEADLRRLERAQADEDFTAADVRLIHELGFVQGGVSGAWLCDRVDLNPGYVCRILGKLEAYGLVRASESSTDRRAREWELTDRGRDFFESIEASYRDRARSALMFLMAEERRRLVDAMAVIEDFLRRRSLSAPFGSPSPRPRARAGGGPQSTIVTIGCLESSE